jgi:Leucine-rich repeat (LRR) protein
MTALEHLVLDNNMLSGSIPAEIGNFVHLERLVLQNNLLEGSVPETIGKLVGVEEFNLNGNQLEGTLPASMAGLLKLSVIFLQDNMFTGSLDNVFNHSSQVWISIIDASNNRLGGSIPETIYRLHQLRVLSLSGEWSLLLRMWFMFMLMYYDVWYTFLCRQLF